MSDECKHEPVPDSMSIMEGGYIETLWHCKKCAYQGVIKGGKIQIIKPPQQHGPIIVRGPRFAKKNSVIVEGTISLDSHDEIIDPKGIKFSD